MSASTNEMCRGDAADVLGDMLCGNVGGDVPIRLFDATYFVDLAAVRRNAVVFYFHDQYQIT
jgi:hypothetical protein